MLSDKYLSIFMTMIITSFIWATCLLYEKNNNSKLNYVIRQNKQIIEMLNQTIKKVDDNNKDLLKNIEVLNEYKFKYYLLTNIENKRNLKVSTKVIDAIYTISKEKNYDLSFLLAWGDVEANLKSNPLPWRKVQGILQIDYNIWKDTLELEKDQLKDPYYNIANAIVILEHYLELSNGDFDLALFYYNNGISGKYKNYKYVPKIKKKQLVYDDIVKVTSKNFNG